jgi:G3E family GTPase
VEFRVEDASLVLTVRVLEDADAVPDIKSRFFSAVGAQRRLEHDELDRVFVVRDHEEHSSEHGEHHHHHRNNKNNTSQNANTANGNEIAERGNDDSREARVENNIPGETRGIEGRAVRVKEKVRVESADPSLMAAMAKIGALEHAVGMARWALSVVMEEEMVEV